MFIYHTFIQKHFAQTLLGIACAVATFGLPYATVAQGAPPAPTPEPYVQFFIADNQSITLPQKDVRAWFTIDTRLIFDPRYRSELENTTRAETCPTPHPGCRFLQSSRRAAHVRKVERVRARTEDIRRFVTRLAKDLYQPPVDARFRMENGRVRVFQPHRNGRELLIDESVDVIARYAQSVAQGTIPQSIKLPSRVLTPTYTMADVNDLGITQLIGEGRSNFAGSPATRIHNIKTAAARFDGVILAPGETLSFTTLLGPVDASTGYAKELVIIDNQTRPEYGGGICQVSTTLFRAAILTGLEITERRNHSYPVKYYQPTGFDATIYQPRPDLKFVNNTPHHIMLHNFIEGTELVFQIYGTSDGRTVEMKGPVVTERKPDGSMKTYFTQKVTAADGRVLIDDIFYSNYKSPRDYPHPGDVARQKFTTKPKNWSKKQWAAYKAANGP